jgi:hypothetical protein
VKEVVEKRVTIYKKSKLKIDYIALGMLTLFLKLENETQNEKKNSVKDEKKRGIKGTRFTFVCYFFW